MPKPDAKPGMKREIAVAATVIVFAVAVVSIISSSSYGAQTLQACRRILLQQPRYSCIYAYANSSMNYSACNMLPGQQSALCITAIARRSRNPDACNSISNPGQLYNCITNVSYETSNQSYCGILKGANSSLCAFDVAKSEGFANSSCAAIQNSSLRQECVYIYDYGKAASLSNTSYCAALPNETNSTLVSEIISKDYTNQTGVSSLESIDFSGLNISARNYCYFSVSVQSGNATSCPGAGPFSSDCAAYVNGSRSNRTANENVTELCSSVPSYADGLCKFSAYTEHALSDRNLSSCMQLGNITYRNSCIMQLAEMYNDSSYCSSIQRNVSLESSCNASS